MTKQPIKPVEHPKEVYLDEKWDHLLDLGLRRLVYGSLAGGLAALVLMRGPSMRLATVAFGAGCGVGSAWQACAKDFETPAAKSSKS